MGHSKLQFRKRESTKKGNKFVYWEICAYYSNYLCSSDEIRELSIYLGIRVTSKRDITAKKELSTKCPDYDEFYPIISAALTRIDFIVDEYYDKHKKKPICSYVKEKYDKPMVIEQQKFDCMTDYYTKYLDFKREDVKEGSMGHYNNNVSAFEQFEKYKNNGVKITFSDFEDKEFWERFIPFLSNEKEDTTRVTQKRYGLTDPVLIRRLKVMREFCRWAIKTYGITMDVDNIEKMQQKVRDKNEIHTYEPTKYSLTLDELQELIWYKPTCYEKDKDQFLFMCLQGTRYSDTQSFKGEKDVIKINGKETVNKKAKKTNKKFRNEFHPVAKALYEKWGSEFNDMTKFNKHIKIVMKEFFMYYKMKMDILGIEYDYTIYVEKNNGTVNSDKVDYKWNIVSSHYGRVSYISLLADTNKLTLKQIGSRTGQVSLETVKGYIRPVSTPTAQELLNVKLEKEYSPLKKVD